MAPSNPGTPGTKTPEKFANHIEGVEWPATKSQLMAKARSTAAPPEVIEALSRIPGERFRDLDEVMVAYESEYGRR